VGRLLSLVVVENPKFSNDILVETVVVPEIKYFRLWLSHCIDRSSNHLGTVFTARQHSTALY